MDENPYQSPTAPPPSDPQRRSAVRLMLAGVSFLTAMFLLALIGKTISVLASLGLDSPLAAGTLPFIAWASLNVVSCGLIARGLLRRRQRLTAIGGSILVLSTLALFFV